MDTEGALPVHDHHAIDCSIDAPTLCTAIDTVLATIATVDHCQPSLLPFRRPATARQARLKGHIRCEALGLAVVRGARRVADSR
jgi:hypothetical protein